MQNPSALGSGMATTVPLNATIAAAAEVQKLDIEAMHEKESALAYYPTESALRIIVFALVQDLLYYVLYVLYYIMYYIILCINRP